MDSVTCGHLEYVQGNGVTWYATSPKFALKFESFSVFPTEIVLNQVCI